MWVTVWYGTNDCRWGTDEFVDLNTPLTDLRDLYVGCLCVEIQEVFRG